MTSIDLTERPRSRAKLEAWYAAALEEQASSGLSVAAYATKIGVTAATLYQWRRRLSCKPDELGANSVEPHGLIQVSLKSPASPAFDRFVVRLERDRFIEVPYSFDESALGRLIAVLDAC